MISVLPSVSSGRDPEPSCQVPCRADRGGDPGPPPKAEPLYQLVAEASPGPGLPAVQALQQGQGQEGLQRN